MSAFDPTTIRQAVAEFTPRRPQKFHELLPAKEVIAELRQKRASYRSIATLLTKHCLPTSKTAIATFCHEVLGEKIRPYRRSSRKRPSIPATSAAPAFAVEPNTTPPIRTRGPRIAQVRMLAPGNEMKRLDLIINGKGGVGKSFFAVNLVQFLKDKGIAHIAIDTDNENSTLKRFHPDAQFLDLSNRRELDGIFGALEKTELVIVDCRAASTDLFLDYFAEVDLPTVLPVVGAALTLVMPVNHELDSVDQVQRLTDQLGKTSSYVVVRNAAHSDSFALFESAEVCAQLKSKFGGREITMPRLQDWLVEALNRENLTITVAAKHSAFSLLDRQRLLTWQRKIFAEIESATELLLPTK